MKALVSGGTGLVGRYIVEALLAAGYQIVIAGRSRPEPDLFPRPVMFRSMSLADEGASASLFQDITCFIHAAFDHTPGRYRGGEGDDPEGFRRRNLDGSVKLFEAARTAGVRRAVFLSSRAVYDGVSSDAVLSETLDLSPSSLYGEIKLETEQALKALAGRDFISTSLRLTGVYGNLRPNKWDALFKAYLAGDTVPVRAGSEVHGCDVGRATRLVLEAEAHLVCGQSFNVSDIIIDTRDILGLIDPSRKNLPASADKSVVAAMDTHKIRALGWLPGGEVLLKSTINSLAETMGC